MRNPEQLIIGEPYEFGAYRPQVPNEKVDPTHVEKRKGVGYVPVRLYGPEPNEKTTTNHAMSPMPLPNSS